MEKRFEHGGNIYQSGAPKGTWTDFSANINPLGLAKTVRDAISSHIDTIIHYPDPQGRQLKKLLAEHYAVPYENLILGNGAAELFYLYMHAFLPKKVLIPVPSFSEYERAAVAVQADIQYVYMNPDDGFAMPWERMYHLCGAADCIIMGNPNNPTGTLIPSSLLEKFIQAAKEAKTDIIIDESFLDFRSDAEKYSVCSLVSSYDNLFVIRSLTKFYAIPGLRLGFAVVHGTKSNTLEKHNDVWNVNSLAQAAGTAALRDSTYRYMSRKYLASTAASLYNKLRTIDGIFVFPPTVNFLLIHSERRKLDAAAIASQLRAYGILIRNCANYPGLDKYYFRLAVRTNEENNKIFQALKKIFE